MRSENQGTMTMEGPNKLMVLAFSCVEQLRKRYPYCSASQLAGKVGVANSTFNRVENKDGTPSLKTLSRLLAATEQVQTMADVGGLLNGDSQVEKNLSHMKNNKLLTGDLAEAFGHVENRMVLLLASTNAGTTRQEIQKDYGLSGINVLDELLRVKVLTEKDGVIKSSVSDGDKPFVLDHQMAKELLSSCIREKYNPENFGTGENWLSFQTESVDVQKVMEAIAPILKEAFTKMDEVIRSKEYEGDGKIFIGMVADSLSLVSESVTNKQKGGMR